MGRKPGIRHKNGHWYTERGGRGRYLGRVSDTTEEEAERRARNTTPLPARYAFNLYLSYLIERGSSVTAKERRRKLSLFLPYVGDKEAGSVSQRELGAFLEAYRGKGLDYVWRLDNAVRACFRWLEREGHIEGFPFSKSARVRHTFSPSLSPLPSPATLRKVIALSLPHIRPMFRLYYLTGARTGELSRARVGDFREGAIILPSHKTSHKGKERRIYLNREATRLVERQRRGREGEASAPLFVNHFGRAWSVRDISLKLKEASEKASTKVVCGDFRKALATDLIEKGTPLPVVSRILGTSVTMLERTYVRVPMQSCIRALERTRARKGRGKK
jgi:integrase